MQALASVHTAFRSIVKAKESAAQNPKYLEKVKLDFITNDLPFFQDISPSEFQKAIYGYLTGINYGTWGLNGSINERVHKQRLTIEDAIKAAKSTSEIETIKNACTRAQLIELGVGEWSYGRSSFIYKTPGGKDVCIGHDHTADGKLVDKVTYREAFEDLKVYLEELHAINESLSTL